MRRLFVGSASVILMLTGIGKILSAVGTDRILRLPDPILGVEFRHLMLMVGIIEVIFAFACLLTPKWISATLLIAWLATGFLFYRIGVWWIGWHRACPCLGSLTGALHMTPQAADTVSRLLFGYLLCGSYAIVLWHWNEKRRGQVREPGKAS